MEVWRVLKRGEASPDNALSSLFSTSEASEKMSTPMSIPVLFVRRLSGSGLSLANAREPVPDTNTRRSNMRVLVFVKANEDTEAGIMPKRQLLEEMGKF